MMLDEAAENKIRNRLSEELQLYVPELKDEKLYSFKVDNESFETIKVQLMALGLIRKSVKKHAPTDTAVYWSLTPYGEDQLMRLRAIRKKKEKDKEKG